MDNTTDMQNVEGTNSESDASDDEVVFNKLLYITMGILLLLSGIFGAILNGIIIAIIRLSKSLNGATYVLLETLCFSQMLISVLGNPFSAAAAFSQKWILGKAGCYYYGFMMTVIGLFAINILTAISVERYITICHPRHKFLVSNRATKTSISLCLATALLWGILPLVGWSEYTQDGIGIGCCPTLSDVPGAYSYTIAMMCLEAFTPVAIIIFCYCNIIRIIYKSKQNLIQHVAVTEEANKKKLSREKKVTITIALTVGAFLVSWGPYTVTSLMYAVDPSSLSPISITVSALVAKCSTIWNPIIYVATNTKFRNAFVRLVTNRQFGQSSIVSETNNDTVPTRTRNNSVQVGSNPVQNDPDNQNQTEM